MLSFVKFELLSFLSTPETKYNTVEESLRETDYENAHVVISNKTKNGPDA